MLVAFWRPPTHPQEEAWHAFRGALHRASASVTEARDVVLAVAAPARIERRPKGAVAWLVGTSPSVDGFDALGPEIRLDDGGQLWCSVGPLPQYALYYHRAPDDAFVVLSSSLALLVRVTGPRRWNLERLAALTVWGPYRDRSATPFVGIRRVLPGEHISLDQEGFRCQRRVHRVGSSYIRGDPRELASALRHQIDAAVGRAIGPARRVAVLAGGGADSSGVLALAVARCRGAPERDLNAIALDFAGVGDDRPYMGELSRALGIVPLRLDPAGAGDHFAPSLCLDAQPAVLSTTCLNILMLQKARELGADVVLTGTSGDAVLGGLPDGFALLAQRGHISRALVGALRVQLSWPSTPLRRVRDLVVRPWIRPRLPMWLRAMRARRSRRAWLTRRWRATQVWSPEWTSDRLPDTPDDWMAFHSDSQVVVDGADIATQVSSVTRCTPIDVYADPQFVRFLVQVDPVHLTYGGVYRGLYREAMQGVVPDAVRLRNDKARFEAAIAAAGRASPDLDRVEELGNLKVLSALGFVDASAFRASFQAYMSRLRGDGNAESDELWQTVWQLLAVEQFLRKYPLAS